MADEYGDLSVKIGVELDTSKLISDIANVGDLLGGIGKNAGGAERYFDGLMSSLAEMNQQLQETAQQAAYLGTAFSTFGAEGISGISTEIYTIEEATRAAIESATHLATGFGLGDLASGLDNVEEEVLGVRDATKVASDAAEFLKNSFEGVLTVVREQLEKGDFGNAFKAAMAGVDTVINQSSKNFGDKFSDATQTALNSIRGLHEGVNSFFSNMEAASVAIQSKGILGGLFSIGESFVAQKAGGYLSNMLSDGADGIGSFLGLGGKAAGGAAGLLGGASAAAGMGSTAVGAVTAGAAEAAGVGATAITEAMASTAAGAAGVMGGLGAEAATSFGAALVGTLGGPVGIVVMGAIGLLAGMLVGGLVEKVMDGIGQLVQPFVVFGQRVMQIGMQVQEELFRVKFAFGDAADYILQRSGELSKDSMFGGTAIAKSMADLSVTVGDYLNDDQVQQLGELIPQVATVTPGHSLDSAQRMLGYGISFGGRAARQLQTQAGIDISDRTMQNYIEQQGAQKMADRFGIKGDTDKYGRETKEMTASNVWSKMDTEKRAQLRYEVAMSPENLDKLKEFTDKYMQSFAGQMGRMSQIMKEPMEGFEGLLDIAAPALKKINDLIEPIVDSFKGVTKVVIQATKAFSESEGVQNFVKALDLDEWAGGAVEAIKTVGEMFLMLIKIAQTIGDNYSNVFEFMAEVINWWASGILNTINYVLQIFAFLIKGLYIIIAMWASGHGTMLEKAADTWMLLKSGWLSVLEFVVNMVYKFVEGLNVLGGKAGDVFANAIAGAIEGGIKQVGDSLAKLGGLVGILSPEWGQKLSEAGESMKNFDLPEITTYSDASKERNKQLEEERLKIIGVFEDAKKEMARDQIDLNREQVENYRKKTGIDLALPENQTPANMVAAKYGFEIPDLGKLLDELKVKIEPPAGEEPPSQKDLIDSLDNLKDTIGAKNMQATINIHVTQTFEDAYSEEEMVKVGKEVQKQVVDGLRAAGVIE